MKLSVLLLALMMVFALSGCGKTEEEPVEEATEEIEEIAEEEAVPEMIGAEYGYAGEDPIEAEVYRYMVEVGSGRKGIRCDRCQHSYCTDRT